MNAAKYLNYYFLFFAIAVISAICPVGTAIAQSKFFSSPGRGADNARQNAQMITLQGEHERMNACTASGHLYGPNHPNADPNGCIQALEISPIGDIGVGTSPGAKLHVVGGRILLQPSSAGPHQGLQINTNDQANGSNAIFVAAPTGWSGNMIKSNLNGIEQFAIRHDGSAWFRGNVGVGVSSAQTALDVAGAIKIAGSAETCGAGKAGAIRYNAASQRMEFCNGSTWSAMGGADVVPSGSVMAFVLSACPSGWSPLVAARGRFVIGTGTLGSDTYGLGATGGEARHTLTVAEMPNHHHGISSQHGAADFWYALGNLGSGGEPIMVYNSYSTPVGPVTTGGNQPHENRPPYLALLYCQKN